LLDLDHDELGGIERGEADQDVDDALVDARLRIIFRIAFDEIGLLWRGSLEGAFEKQILHEGADVEPDLAPKPLVIGFEYHPLRAIVQARLEKQGEPPDWNIFPLRASLVTALQSSRAPCHVAVDSEFTQAIDGLDVEIAVFEIGKHVLEAGDA